MPEVSRITYQFSAKPEYNPTMPLLRVEILASEKEGAGMRSEEEIREKLETLRHDKRDNIGRDNRCIYQLALCWVLEEYEEWRLPK